MWHTVSPTCTRKSNPAGHSSLALSAAIFTKCPRSMWSLPNLAEYVNTEILAEKDNPEDPY